MVQIGRFNQLTVIKEVPFGLYLDGGEQGSILLPGKVVPKGLVIGDRVHVFVYFDSEDKIIATTVKPKVLLGGFAFLKVVDVNRFGAFLDWGLDKDLLVPQPEQQRPMEAGKSYLVYVKQDNQGRIIASSRLERALHTSPAHYSRGEEVSLLIAERTPLGQKVIINETHWGLIHESEIFQSLRYGQQITGYIKTLREDGKIDVVLRKAGQDNIHDLAGRILAELQKNGGFLPLHDKSSPEEIQRALGASKKSFKNAIGQLYKKGEISIEEEGLRLQEGK